MSDTPHADATESLTNRDSEVTARYQVELRCSVSESLEVWYSCTLTAPVGCDEQTLIDYAKHKHSEQLEHNNPTAEHIEMTAVRVNNDWCEFTTEVEYEHDGSMITGTAIGAEMADGADVVLSVLQNFDGADSETHVDQPLLKNVQLLTQT